METRLTSQQQDRALELVAAWLGPKLGYDGPAPTGKDAAYTASGPMLNPEWDWPSSGPTPTILLEGGPDDWAIFAAHELADQMAGIGVFAEPYACYALCLYPA
ncbi:hypothetical protein CHO01_21880 [Cellulomonas hominis]|uniref:DUF4253 domain-containing protein n=1 Tax=Cellulomonas hominis TaxID=156981 RepID=A0A511FD00_9CELL|nr:hypothetical protein [Cellulomonas hominis]MBB5474689.1 hypothetical protein [Cellulomonas hominis]NKY05754.1 hypothetical protein [Cellulomonas hominis]GEL47072.1 hypothetical protein CHO01_21880 [Cellulomonas hominis]